MQGSVPRNWPESTVVCLGTGPSLTLIDTERLKFRFPTIAVNSAITLAPWADLLFAADKKWWDWNTRWRDRVGGYPPYRFTTDRQLLHHPTIVFLRPTGMGGLETSPACVRTGGTSGYAAVNIAVHMGARRIILVGYDMQPSAEGQHHFFGEYPDHTHPGYNARLKLWPPLYEQLQSRNIALINASRTSALPGEIPRMSLDELLHAA